MVHTHQERPVRAATRSFFNLNTECKASHPRFSQRSASKSWGHCIVTRKELVRAMRTVTRTTKNARTAAVGAGRQYSGRSFHVLDIVTLLLRFRGGTQTTVKRGALMARNLDADDLATQDGAFSSPD